MNLGVTAAIFAPPIVALSYALFVAVRRRSSVGGRYLVYLLTGSLLWLCGYAVQLNVVTPQWNVLVAQVEFVGVVVSPVFFMLFAGRYTQGYSLSKRQELGLFLVPAVTLVLVWTNPLHHLMWSDFQIRLWNGLALVDREFGPWYLVHALYSYLTFLAGVLQFVTLLSTRNFLFRRQAVAVIIGTIVPVMLTVPYLLGLSPVEGLDLTPFALAIGGIAFSYAFVDTEFYDVVPAIKTIGWANVAGKIDSGIVVTDTRTNVVEANETLCGMFDVERAEIIGEPVTALFHPDETVGELTDGCEVSRRDGSIFEIRASSVRDGRGDRLGFTFTFVDVTERKSREQQLQVLNRVLRHNLRNRAMVMTGNAERIEVLSERAAADSLEEVGDLAAEIVQASERVTEMGETAREIDGIIQDSTVTVQSLATVVEGSRTELERKGVEGTVTVDIDEDLYVRAPQRLEKAIAHLLQNALRHNPSGTNVSVDARRADGTVELRVRDDGDGIPDHELEPIESGMETALDHGSGLGLWFVKWTVESSNGTVAIDTDPGEGTTITVTLPAAEPATFHEGD